MRQHAEQGIFGRTLRLAALKVSDRTLAGQLRALADDCARRAEKAAQADAARVSALNGLNLSFPKSSFSARSQAARAALLGKYHNRMKKQIF
jgi:hypothetical protein